MQWLIDIIKEWCIAQGYLTAGFVNRGDPTSDDFAIGDFTLDGMKHDLDLSSIVPENASGVVFILTIKSDATGDWCFWLPSEHIRAYNGSRRRTQVANIIVSADFTLPIGPSRNLKYEFKVANWEIINVTVKGWWF